MERHPCGGPTRQGTEDVGRIFRGGHDDPTIRVAPRGLLYGLGRRAAHNDDGRLLALFELPDPEPRIGPSFFEAEYLASAREQHRPALEPPGYTRQGEGQPIQDRSHRRHAFRFRLFTGTLSAFYL